MPSPFPGMDPYLEGPLWTNVHTQLSVEIAGQLAPRLRPRYVPLTEKRFVLATAGAEDGVAIAAAAVDIRPDVGVAHASGGPPTPGGAGAAAVAAVPPPVRMTTLMPVPVPHITVEIRDVENRRLVTAIEVLSPTDKRGGRREYLRKRRRLLLSTAHLMEIDLLRAGRRVPMREPLPDVPYFVFLSRAEERPVTDVWPIGLTGPLPNVPVPLLAGDADVELDLQQALTAVYDRFSYDMLIDYTRPPKFPLPPADGAWAREHLGIPRAPTAT